MSEALRTAAEIADTVLFPAAAGVDAADRVPASHLDLLAEHGFYGLSTVDLPDYPSVLRLVETLAGGCLNTTFVWMQHHGPVMTLARSANEPLREKHLDDLIAGRARAGVAVGAAVRPGPPLLRAEPVEGGYLFDGSAPWVSGWDMIDTLHTAARDAQDVLVLALLDAVASDTVSVEPLDLLAVRASRTVTLTFTRHFVPAERIVHTVPQAEYLTGDAESQRFNGALALGIAGRAITLLGDAAGALPVQLEAARTQLHTAAPEDIAQARAVGSELALRAANACAVHHGSRSLLPGSDAQRLVREATFLLLFGSRPAIRTALLAKLTG
ncbi:acyl-CoA dehydrogenase family protein [Crossiella cryophila]|uniref:Alkylation response protein AidB-like acyl-CoA dehydrogenase n=1 Tax=Crossiella cryophila TaxID=43355 RepID=A0A7W7FT34_9PSEU|nr:acyl-CoA dehydrogenase family protein [Crossiella cryophila]MBB4677706.1 alkylation response protein AidB-like acyl-CoA dehydrogenase [Crossiella cryophila]